MQNKLLDLKKHQTAFLLYVPKSLQILKRMEGRDQRQCLTKSGQHDGYLEFASEEQGAFKPEWRRQSTWLWKGVVEKDLLLVWPYKYMEKLKNKQKSCSPIRVRALTCRHELWNSPHRSHLTAHWQPEKKKKEKNIPLCAHPPKISFVEILVSTS